MKGTRVLQVISIAAVVAVAAPASAQNRSLERAEQAYADLEYEKVLPLLKKALKASKSPTEQARIFELMGMMYVTYGKGPRAKRAFIEMLSRRPDYEIPPEASPKVRETLLDAMETVRKANEAKAAKAEGAKGGKSDPNAEPKPDSRAGAATADATPSPGEDGAAQGSAVEGDDPAGRTADVGAADETGDGQATATILAAPADSDTTLALRVDAPPVVEEDSSGFYESWWFWTIIGGVVVAGGAAAATFFLYPPAVPEHDFGPYPMGP